MRNAAPFVRRAVSITPLIDVVFLLLFFFMLSSTFSNFGEIELTQATAGASAQDSLTERVFVQLGATRLVLNGAPVDLDALADQIERGQVLVSLDDDTTAQRLVDLLAELRGGDALSVIVLE
ncbi:MAG: biopolymer transporter ExbD [Pseudomonadota bacterium]